MVWTQLPVRPLVLGVGAVLVLGGAAGLAAWLGPRPAPGRMEELRAEASAKLERTVEVELSQSVRQLMAQNATLTAQLQASSRQQQDVATRTVERIERYVPGPSAPLSAPAPVVVVRDGEPPEASGVTGPQLAEVITRTIEAVDKSRTVTEVQGTEMAAVTTATDTQVQGMERESATAKAESTEKLEEKVAVSPVDAAELPRFGAGYTSARQPFVSYDLARGPKVLGLERVGLGVFATKASSGGLDGGPQASLALSRGKRWEPFAMVGYQVRDRTPVVGVGVKF